MNLKTEQQMNGHMYKDPILECTYLGAHSCSPNQSTGFMLATGLCLTSHPYCWVASFLGMRLLTEQQTIKSVETTSSYPDLITPAFVTCSANSGNTWYNLSCAVTYTVCGCQVNRCYDIQNLWYVCGCEWNSCRVSIGQTRWARSIGWIGFRRLINSCK